MWEKNENKQKEAGFGPFLKIIKRLAESAINYVGPYHFPIPAGKLHSIQGIRT